MFPFRACTVLSLVALLLGCRPSGAVGSAGGYRPSPMMEQLERETAAAEASNRMTIERLETLIEERSADLARMGDPRPLIDRAEGYRAAAHQHRGTHRILTVLTSAVAAVGAGAKVSNEYWISSATVLTLWRTSTGDAKSAETRAAEACEGAARGKQTTIEDFRWMMTNLVDEARESDADASRLVQISRTLRERHEAARRALHAADASCPQSIA